MRMTGIVMALVAIVVAPLAAQELSPEVAQLGPRTAWTPPVPCTGMFTDVPCGSQFDTWIEQLARDGITSGCAAGQFCPSSPVTRKQMAVFVERSMRGASGWPPNTVLVYPVKNADGSPNPTASGTELLTRVASIPTTGPDVPTDLNRWAVEVAAGLYDLGGQTLTLRSYVTLRGAGATATAIMSTGGGTAATPAVAGVADSTVLDVTIFANSTQSWVVGLRVTGAGFRAERVAVYAMNGASGSVGVDAQSADRLLIRDSDVQGIGVVPYGVRVSDSTDVEIDRCRIAYASTGNTLGSGIELTGAEARITETRVRHTAEGTSRGAGLYMHGASTCQLDNSQLRGDTVGSSSAYGAYVAGESVLRSEGSEFVSETSGTGTSYGIYCSGSSVTVYGGKVWGDDYGVFTTGSSTTHSCSIQHVSLQGLAHYSISNGPNYNTLLASAELRGGGTTSSGTLWCVAVYDTAGGFWANTCP
jgi:hypothetical protein